MPWETKKCDPLYCNIHFLWCLEPYLQYLQGMSLYMYMYIHACVIYNICMHVYTHM